MISLRSRSSLSMHPYLDIPKLKCRTAERKPFNLGNSPSFLGQCEDRGASSKRLPRRQSPLLIAQEGLILPKKHLGTIQGSARNAQEESRSQLAGMTTSYTLKREVMFSLCYGPKFMLACLWGVGTKALSISGQLEKKGFCLGGSLSQHGHLCAINALQDSSVWARKVLRRASVWDILHFPPFSNQPP